MFSSSSPVRELAASSHLFTGLLGTPAQVQDCPGFLCHPPSFQPDLWGATQGTAMSITATLDLGAVFAVQIHS